MNMTTKFYNLSMLFTHPPDIPAIWVVQILDFDLVTQGDSLAQAMQMALEATALIVQWDVAAGKDPADRRAPAEEWDAFLEVVTHGQALTGLQSVDEKHLRALAVQALCLFDIPAATDAATAVRKPRSAARKTAPAPPSLVLQRQPIVWPTAA